MLAFMGEFFVGIGHGVLPKSHLCLFPQCNIGGMYCGKTLFYDYGSTYSCACTVESWGSIILAVHIR